MLEGVSKPWLRSRKMRVTAEGGMWDLREEFVVSVMGGQIVGREESHKLWNCKIRKHLLSHDHLLLNLHE